MMGRTGPSGPASEGGDSFRFTHRVTVRFRDLDPMGHAHRSLPLIYFAERSRPIPDDVRRVIAEREGIAERG